MSDERCEECGHQLSGHVIVKATTDQRSGTMSCPGVDGVECPCRLRWELTPGRSR